MWNGEGFPPVGTVCECNCFGEWQRGEVVEVTERMCRVRFNKNSPDFVFIYKDYIRPKTEWNGEGFPPVGTVCEFLCDEVWLKAKVIGSSSESCLAEIKHNYRIYTENPNSIRPIKTAVEIGNEIHEQADWNGEGFPPVGIECEIKYRNKWVPCHVIGMDDLGNCVARHDMEYLATQLTEHFRPLRTERQIAQEDMRQIAYENPYISQVDLFGLIHDAGYTK